MLIMSTTLLQATDNEDAIKVAEKAHIANINTLLIFTSQEGLSSGLYKFTDVGVDMELYSLPFTYNFKSSTQFNYFLVGNVGYSRVAISDNIDIPEDSRLNYANHLQTYTGGLGGGLRYKFNEDWSASAGMEFIYSRSGTSIKSEDDNIGDVVEDFFKENYNDNISYKFFTNIEYRTIIDKYKIYTIFKYKLYETKSNFSFEELSDFRSESSVMTLSLGGETPSVFQYNKNYITLEAYLNANYLSGAVKDIVKFNKYSTVGGVVYLNTPDEPLWASRFFLEVSTVHSSGLEGYNIGVGFSVDF